MNAITKTTLAIFLLLAGACEKEGSMHSLSADEISMQNVTTNIAAKYSFVKIGNQKWMTENLNVTHYKNGDKIPQVRNQHDWDTLTTGAWCWYKNDSAKSAVYGKLYNWFAVNDPRGLAPTGWHVASDAEWDTLTAYLGGSRKGGKLKDTGTVEAGTGWWHEPNNGATNKTGFTALPGGYRSYSNGIFYYNGYEGLWWTSTKYDNMCSWARYLYNNAGTIDRGGANKPNGFSVRCIKDII